MSVAVETSARLLASALAKLDGAGSATRLDAEVLLAHALDAPRTRLHAWPDEPVSAARAAHFRTLVARRADGEPVAHLTGRREFWSLSLEVTADTLIPRPETERLVEVALSLVAGDRAAAVAELGTGSGAVAAAIASERPSWRVVATDLCPRALAVAARNMARLGLDNVALRSGDWLDALAGERFALIVANPPYVACDDPHLGRGDVRFEPALALRAGRDGLDAIRRIAASARAHLLPGAALALEHGYDQGPAVHALLRQHGYRELRGYRDLAGNDRVAVGLA
jgi:release factor glutamine methyltransferase